MLSYFTEKARNPVVMLLIIAVSISAISGLVANTILSESNAGQGVVVVEGYYVDNIYYVSTMEEDSEAETIFASEVFFDITKDDGDVTPATEEVYVQFREIDDDVYSDWVQCDIIIKTQVECDMLSQEFSLEKIDSLNVMAYELLPEGVEPITSGD